MAKEMIAMILAGGQGSRLYALTQKARQAGSSVWRKVSYHRLPAVQLCQL